MLAKFSHGVSVQVLPVEKGLEFSTWLQSQQGPLTIPEAGLGLPQTVRNQDSKPVQGILRNYRRSWLFGLGRALAPAQSWRKKGYWPYSPHDHNELNKVHDSVNTELESPALVCLEIGTPFPFVPVNSVYSDFQDRQFCLPITRGHTDFAHFT